MWGRKRGASCRAAMKGPLKHTNSSGDVARGRRRRWGVKKVKRKSSGTGKTWPSLKRKNAEIWRPSAACLRELRVMEKGR